MDVAGEKGKELAPSLFARVGMLALIGTAVLIVSWFALNYFSMNLPVAEQPPVFSTRLHPTFWQSAGFVKLAEDDLDDPVQFLNDAAKSSGSNSENPPTGFYGFLIFLAMLGPLLPAVWKNRWAVLGGLLPLIFTLLFLFHGFRVFRALGEALLAQAQMFAETLKTLGLPQANAQGQDAASAKDNFQKMIDFRIGLGFYISSLVALFLAGNAGIRCITSKGRPS
jgi:hypothetical protein